MKARWLAASAIVVLATQPGEARTFNGDPCTVDCSGHSAGYAWAERKGVTSEDDCPLRGRATSFYEGCKAYLDDPTRGADTDDDGEPIER